MFGSVERECTGIGSLCICGACKGAVCMCMYISLGLAKRSLGIDSLCIYWMYVCALRGYGLTKSIWRLT